MNKITAVIVTAITAVAMSACSGGSSEPAVTHTETVTSAPQAPSNESAFIQTIRGEFPNAQGSDEDIMAMGNAVCGALDSGRGIEGIADDIVETSGGFDYYDAGIIIGASVRYLCPEHQNQTI